jgi:hypothetical protein
MLASIGPCPQLRDHLTPLPQAVCDSSATSGIFPSPLRPCRPGDVAARLTTGRCLFSLSIGVGVPTWCRPRGNPVRRVLSQIRSCPRNCQRRTLLHEATGRKRPGRRSEGDDPRARRPACASHPSDVRGARTGRFSAAVTCATVAGGWSMTARYSFGMSRRVPLRRRLRDSFTRTSWSMSCRPIERLKRR